MKTRLLPEPTSRAAGPRSHTVRSQGQVSSPPTPPPASAASLAGHAPLGLVFLKPVTPRRCSPCALGAAAATSLPGAGGTGAPVFGASVRQGGCRPGAPRPRRGPPRLPRREMRITYRAFFPCLLGRILYALRSSGHERRHPPSLNAPTLPPAPLGPDNRQGGLTHRGRYLKEGWPACPPPLTSLPPHVSRPGWYPAPLGSWSRQLRHQLKHGLDVEELTSQDHKHLCTEMDLKGAWGSGSASRSCSNAASVGNRARRGLGPPLQAHRPGCGDAAATRVRVTSDLHR